MERSPTLTNLPAIQINYLATMLFALLLIPAMKSSLSNPNAPVMSLVSSWSIYPAHLTMKSPNGAAKSKVAAASANADAAADAPFLRFLCANKDGNGQQQQYGRSKLLCVTFMKELAARVPASKVILNCQDPGTAWTAITEINRQALAQRFFMKITARPVDVCARTLVHAVLQTEETHGKLMVDYDVVRYLFDFFAVGVGG